MLMEGAGRGGGGRRDVFLRPPPSVPVSQLLVCVWVSLSLSVSYLHLSELPSEALQTPELRAPTRTLTKELEFEKSAASEPWGCPVLDITP